jgi:hypothetical protein
MTDFEIQCSICPKCHDDHSQNGPCSPPSVGIFMPRDDDHSLIAREYRARVFERDGAYFALEKIIDGPGQKMEGWKHTWVHRYAVDALMRLKGIK